MAMTVGDEALACAELERTAEARVTALRRAGVLVSVDDVGERFLPVGSLRGGSLPARVKEVRPQFALVLGALVAAFARPSR